MLVRPTVTAIALLVSASGFSTTAVASGWADLIGRTVVAPMGQSRTSGRNFESRMYFARDAKLFWYDDRDATKGVVVDLVTREVRQLDLPTESHVEIDAFGIAVSYSSQGYTQSFKLGFGPPCSVQLTNVFGDTYRSKACYVRDGKY